MFRFAGITKSGFSILTEVLKNNKSLEDVMYYKIKLESYKIEE